MINEYHRRAISLLGNVSIVAPFLRPDKEVLELEPFGYSEQIDGVNAGASATGEIKTDADSDFILQYMSAQQVGASSPGMTCQITDKASGKTFFETPILYDQAFGLRGIPFILPFPKVIGPSTGMDIRVTNVSILNNQSIVFLFFGTRVFYKG